MDCKLSTNLETDQPKVQYTSYILAGVLSLALCACKDNSVQSYTIPKSTDTGSKGTLALAESSGTKSKMQALPGMGAFTQSSPDIAYNKPDSWTEIAPTSIRKANFIVDNESGEAEVSVTVFPGDVGGLLANINRWRNQIGLDPLEAVSLGESLENTVIAQHPAYFTKHEGNTQSILAGILPFHGSTWFIKMQGSILCIDGEEANFRAFLSSFTIKDHHH